MLFLILLGGTILTMGVMAVVLTLVSVSSVAEMAVAAVVAIALCKPLRAYMNR